MCSFQLMLNQQAHQKQLEKKMSNLEKQLLEVSFSSQNSGGSVEEFEKLHEINASLEGALAEHITIITELQSRVRLVSSVSPRLNVCCGYEHTADIPITCADHADYSALIP